MLPALRCLSLALLVLVSPLAQAHKVIFDVFISGSVIEGELGFSSGDMAVGQTIDVFNGRAERVGHAVTDEDGFFQYTPTAATDLVFKADLGAGHVAEAGVAVAEVAAMLGVAVAPQPTAKTMHVVDDTDVHSANEQLVAQLAVLSSDVKNLRAEMRAYKDKNDMQTVLGGIGYIFGLFGLAFYLAARRKLGQQ